MKNEKIQLILIGLPSFTKAKKTHAKVNYGLMKEVRGTILKKFLSVVKLVGLPVLFLRQKSIILRF
jgi:hypothetical protein